MSIITDTQDTGREDRSFWLNVVGLVVIISPLRYTLMLVSIYRALGDNPVWNALKTPGSPFYDPTYRSIAYTEFFIVFSFVCLTSYNVYLFFKRKKNFPLIFMWLLFCSLFFVLGQNILYSFVYRYMDRNTTLMVVDLTLRTLITLTLIPYMCYSQKVKELFIH